MLSCLASTALAEGVTRLSDGNALSVLDIFASERGLILLKPKAHARVRSADGAVHDIHTDGLGVRVAAESAAKIAEGSWLVVGDSQVLGQGVSAGETMTARAAMLGLPCIGAGVPGHGVEDALEHASRLMPRIRPRGIVVVVNQANDWDEAGSPAAARFRVQRGFLLRRRGERSLAERLLATPLAESHLIHQVIQLVHALRGTGSDERPAWLADRHGRRAATDIIVRAIQRFSMQHAELPVKVAFLPVDAATSAERAAASPFARLIPARAEPWRDHELRDALARRFPEARFIDFSPVLSADPAMFQRRDYHLSRLGHAALAEQLVAELRPAFEKTSAALPIRGEHEP